jgi:hypothetical protein
LLRYYLDITLFYYLFTKNLFIMKKFMILLAVACFIFASCETKPAVTEPEPAPCEMALNLEKWATLNDEGVDQEALVLEVKAYLDGWCKENCKETEECTEPCPEKEAFKAKWEAFDELTLEEKIEIIDNAFAHIKECCQKEAEVAEVTEETPAE